MEPYDALTGRFEKLTETIFGKLFKSIEIFERGESSGTLRDKLNFMEKLDLISDIDSWMSIRSIRNRIAHEYDAHDVAMICP